MSTCECGAGWTEDDGVVTITPHAMDCAELRRIVSVGKAGYCVECGSELSTREDLNLVERWCPKGHRREMEWRRV
jgi:hypothetical protein